MGISPLFVIKHARPYGIHAINDICAQNGQFYGYMLNGLNMSAQDADAIVNVWANVGVKEMSQQNMGFFRDSARGISEGRWNVLYQNNTKSTVLFMEQDALVKLSETAGNHPSNHNHQYNKFNVEIDSGSIPLAITINRNPNVAPTYNWNVLEISIGVDQNGNCDHFGGVVNSEH